MADRVTFQARDAADPSLSVQHDLAVIVDALHDTSRPVDMLAIVRRLLAPGGTLIVADERVADAFQRAGRAVDLITMESVRARLDELRAHPGGCRCGACGAAALGARRPRLPRRLGPAAAIIRHQGAHAALSPGVPFPPRRCPRGNRRPWVVPGPKETRPGPPPRRDGDRSCRTPARRSASCREATRSVSAAGASASRSRPRRWVPVGVPGGFRVGAGGVVAGPRTNPWGGGWP